MRGTQRRSGARNGRARGRVVLQLLRSIPLKARRWSTLRGTHEVDRRAAQRISSDDWPLSSLHPLKILLGPPTPHLHLALLRLRLDSLGYPVSVGRRLLLEGRRLVALRRSSRSTVCVQSLHLQDQRPPSTQSWSLGRLLRHPLRRSPMHRRQHRSQRSFPRRRTTDQ